MKQTALTILLSLSLLCTLPAHAHSDAQMDPRTMAVYGEITKMAQSCLVKTNDQTTKSICDTLIIDSKNTARVFVDGRWYFAMVMTSDEADGGDLDDLYLFTEKQEFFGEIAEIVSFGDVTLALMGGENAPLEE